MRGSKWNGSNIAQMLRFPVYRGALVYNKRTSGSLFSMDKNGKLQPKNGRRGNFKNVKDDWIVIEGVHEPLVAPELFEAAQVAFNKRRDAGGKARSVRRTLLSTLLVCKRCGMSFTTVRDYRRNPKFGEFHRYYTCSGYHRYGKKTCGLVRIPGAAFDAFVLEIITRTMLGHSKTVKQAVDAFVKTVSKKPKPNDSDATRQLEQIDRRIKATIKLLSDPTFEGFEDLHLILADLKRQRDSLVKTKRVKVEEVPSLSQTQLREWATAQLENMTALADRTEVDLADRQLVESIVRRIEIEPETKTGTVFLHADLSELFASTRVNGGDDPQTDESARSLSQCANRESILAGAVLGLAGPGKKISGIMPCTVIRPGDMADSILDRDKHPEWNGERTKLVYAFPTNESLWAKYAQIRADGFRIGDGGKAATEFYRENRSAMDEGAIVAWPERFNHDELSAIQHAMNLKLQDEAAFFAEYQNEPLPEETVGDDLLSADQIASKINNMPRRAIPIGCDLLTEFIDVQQNLLFYVIAAWESDFTGYVIDYGSYPDQQRAYFTLRDARLTLAHAAPNTGVEGAIYAGLETLTGQHLSREWMRDDGAAMRIERCLVDANWGSSTDLVYQFCRQSPHAAVLLPSHGRFVGASSAPYSDYKRRPGDRVGLNWRIPNVRGKRAVRHVLFDANFWKSFIQARLGVAMGDRGCLSLFGSKPEQHRLFAEHLTAEYRVKTEGRGRTVDEWKIRPEQPDNHWLDCLVGSAVAGFHPGRDVVWDGDQSGDETDAGEIVGFETQPLVTGQPPITSPIKTQGRHGNLNAFRLFEAANTGAV